MRTIKQKGPAFVLVSILFHIMLMLIIFNFFKNDKDPQNLNREIEVNFVEEPFVKTDNTTSTKDSNKVTQPQKDSTQEISLRDLMPKTGYRKKNIFENTEKQEALAKEIVVEDLSFYRELWKKLDAKFYYPDIFNTLQLHGGAYLDVYINPDGSLSRYVLNVEGVNEHIEFFIKQLVVDALRTPLHKKFWHPKKDEIKLGVSFHLDMVTSPEALDNYSKGRVNRRQMYFHRKVFNPKAHIISKTLPFMAGPGMVDIVYMFNALSGRQKRIHQRNIKKLKAFRLENEKAYNRKYD